MKCKQCAGNYRTRELMCPYCGTPNLLGRIWKVEKEDAEKEYLKTKETTKQAMPYVVNRICHRVLLVEVAIFALYIIGAFLFFFISEMVGRIDYQVNRNSIESKMMAAYSEQDYETLDALVDKYKSLGDEDYYVYTQATILYRDYNTFLEDRAVFLNLSEEKKMDDSYRLSRSIDSAVTILKMECGLYSDLAVENEAQYEEYCVQVRAYLVGMLGFTPEELELCENEDYLRSSDEDMLVQNARLRRAWQ